MDEPNSNYLTAEGIQKLQEELDYLINVRRPEVARQIAEVEAGLREPVMRVGNLEARRDFSDVRDLVGAYWLLLRKGEPGEAYNVCGGSDRSIAEVLELLLSMSDAAIRVDVDPERLRKSDIPVLRGDNGKMREVTGWSPERSLEETLGDVLGWWREELGRQETA